MIGQVAGAGPRGGHGIDPLVDLVGIDVALLEHRDALAQRLQLVAELGLGGDPGAQLADLAGQQVDVVGAAGEVVEACREVLVGSDGCSREFGNVVEAPRERLELRGEVGAATVTTASLDLGQSLLQRFELGTCGAAAATGLVEAALQQLDLFDDLGRVALRGR